MRRSCPAEAQKSAEHGAYRYHTLFGRFENRHPEQDEASVGHLNLWEAYTEDTTAHGFRDLSHAKGNAAVSRVVEACFIVFPLQL